jgi:hypothetical protein
MLNKSGHPYLVSDFRGNGFTFSPLSSFYSYFLQRFYHERMLKFEGFSCIYWYDDIVFCPWAAFVLYYAYWFANVVPSLHSWNETYLIMVYDIFIVLLDSVSNYFIEDFWSYVYQGYWPKTFSFFVSLPDLGIRVIRAP